jgi:hypothetical protein
MKNNNESAVRHIRFSPEIQLSFVSMSFHINIEELAKTSTNLNLRSVNVTMNWKKTYYFCGVCEYLTDCAKYSETSLPSNKTEGMDVAICADFCEHETFTHFGLQVIVM